MNSKNVNFIFLMKEKNDTGREKSLKADYL